MDTKMVIGKPFLYEWSFIWFDPSVNEPSKKPYRQEFSSLFQDPHFDTDSQKAIDDMKTIKNRIFLVSCGSQYEKVKEVAEKAENVIAIIIFCGNVKTYLPYQANCAKIVGVLNNFTEVKSLICLKAASLNAISFGSEPKAGDDECKIIMFDPDINSPENKNLKDLLKPLFNSVTFYDNEKDTINDISKFARKSIVLSSASKYLPIKPFVESNANVVGIVLRCQGKKELYEPLQKCCPKILGVVTNNDELMQILNREHAKKVQLAGPIKAANIGLAQNIIPAAFSNQGALKDFNMVWLDSSFSYIEYCEMLSYFQNFFNCGLLTPTPGHVLDFIKSSTKPVVVISSGGGYSEIKGDVEPQARVLAIIIFCSIVKAHRYRQKECKKIVGVFSDPGKLESFLLKFKLDNIPVDNLEEEKLTCDPYLHSLTFIWFDPNVNNPNNMTRQNFYKGIFGETVYVDKDQDVEQIVNGRKNSIIFMSCGRFYEQVRKIVETSPKVIGIIIFCGDIKKNAHYAEECPKVLGVVSTDLDIENTFDKIVPPSAPKKFLYGIEDKDEILRALQIKIKNDISAIFFPLGLKGINIAEYMNPEIFKEITIQVQKDPMFKQDASKILEALKFLSTCKKLEDFFEYDVCERLFYMMNQYLTMGKIEILKYLLLCLRGTMSLSKRIPSECQKLFHLMAVSGNMLKAFSEKVGEMALLPVIAYCSSDLSKVGPYAIEKAEKNAILEINLDDDVEKYEHFMGKFKFPERNGFLFPVSLSISGLKDVFLPPFYPIQIVNIDTSLNPCIIKANAPRFINLINQEISVVEAAPDLDWNIAYLDSLINYGKVNALTKLNIANMELNKNPKQFDKLSEVILEQFPWKILIIGNFFCYFGVRRRTNWR